MITMPGGVGVSSLLLQKKKKRKIIINTEAGVYMKCGDVEICIAFVVRVFFRLCWSELRVD